MADGRADLAAASIAVTIAAAIVLAGVLPDAARIAVGVPLVLFLPGYALSRAVFGDMRGGAAERIVFSAALSVTVVILGGLLLNLSPWSLNADAWTVLILLVTLGACAVAARLRRPRQPEWMSWRTPSARDVTLLAAAVLLAGGAIALGRTPLDPPEDVRGYTELSQVRTAGAIRLKVTAKELHRARYRLDLRADGRLVRRWRTPVLDPGQDWTKALPLASMRRFRVLEAQLYRPSAATPYRRVKLDLRRGRS